MNEGPVERYSSITIRPYRPDLCVVNKLTPEEKRADRIGFIDRAEREIVLIRQGIGKWPDSKADSRIDDLLWHLRILWKPDDNGVADKPREERLEYLERCLMHYREEVNNMNIPHAVNPAEPRKTSYSWLLLLAGVWCIVLALANFDHYWPYQLSRWVVCAVAIHGALRFETGWKWVLWTLAVLFNPIVPVHFGRNAWQVVDGLAALCFFISNFLKK
jgi:hypothetical protein